MQDQNQGLLLFSALLLLAAVGIGVVVWGVLRTRKRGRTSSGISLASGVPEHAAVNRDNQSSHAENSAEESTIKTRLGAVMKHPEYPALLTVTPSASHLYAGSGCFIVFGLIFALVALVLSFVVPRSMGGVGPALLVRALLLAFAAVGAGMVVWGIAGLRRLRRSGLLRLPALVVDKRIDVSGGQSTQASTSYYVTLALGDGQRRELAAGGELYGQLARDDIGVAYIRAHALLDFRRLAS